MNSDEVIVLDHGSGGKLSNDLVEQIIAPSLKDVYIGEMEDSAVLDVEHNKIAMTTDSFVIDPIFFKNGDIGKISICGTVNDLVVSGSLPKFLTFSLILEEGFLINDLKKILDSVNKTALEANIKIVAGDTKVVKKGDIDKIAINTAGVGIFKQSHVLKLDNIKTNDDVIVSGYVGNHGIHILSMRAGLGFESNVLSDCAPLNTMLFPIIEKFGDKIHFMRDLTRGGMGSIFNEIAQHINKKIIVEEANIPVQSETKMASEMLGINHLYLANEGNVCIFCDKSISNDVVAELHKCKYGQHASICGQVTNVNSGAVVMNTIDNHEKVIEFLVNQELPRLC